MPCLHCNGFKNCFGGYHTHMQGIFCQSDRSWCLLPLNFWGECRMYFQMWIYIKVISVPLNEESTNNGLILLKWLRIQCRQKRKIRQRDQIKRRNCQQKCFHSFNYIIDHTSISFFFCINSLHCFVWFLLYYLLHLLSSDHFAALKSLYKIFIWIWIF